MYLLAYSILSIQTSKIFEGKEFCVINGPSSLSKAAIEKKVAEYGGSVVQNPGKITFFMHWYCVNMCILTLVYYLIASKPKCIGS